MEHFIIHSRNIMHFVCRGPSRMPRQTDTPEGSGKIPNKIKLARWIPFYGAHPLMAVCASNSRDQTRNFSARLERYPAPHTKSPRAPKPTGAVPWKRSADEVTHRINFE